jgi:hypothetical protein
LGQVGSMEGFWLGERDGGVCVWGPGGGWLSQEGGLLLVFNFLLNMHGSPPPFIQMLQDKE